MIVGYIYAADVWGPDCECLIREMIARREASPAALDMPVEQVLDQIASANAIDRSDELSFDSDDFPKPVSSSVVERPVPNAVNVQCSGCGNDLYS